MSTTRRVSHRLWCINYARQIPNKTIVITAFHTNIINNSLAQAQVRIQSEKLCSNSQPPKCDSSHHPKLLKSVIGLGLGVLMCSGQDLNQVSNSETSK